MDVQGREQKRSERFIPGANELDGGRQGHRRNPTHQLEGNEGDHRPLPRLPWCLRRPGAAERRQDAEHSHKENEGTLGSRWLAIFTAPRFAIPPHSASLNNVLDMY